MADSRPPSVSGKGKTWITGSWLQWGSEYQTSLVLEWSKRGWIPNGLVFECHWNKGQPNHLNTKQMDAILFSYVLVWYLNGWSSTWDRASDRVFEYQTIWNPNFKNFGIQLLPAFKWTVFRSPLNSFCMFIIKIKLTAIIKLTNLPCIIVQKTYLASSFSEIGFPFLFQMISSGTSPVVSQTREALSPFRTDKRTEVSRNRGGAKK